MATDAAALSATLSGAAGVGRERILVVALSLVIAIVVVFATILLAAHWRRGRRAVDPTRTHATAAAAIGLARMAAPTMSAWAALPVASMTATPPPADDRTAAKATATSPAGAPRLRVAMAHPSTDPAAPPVESDPPAADAPAPGPADAGSYATLADHPESAETMAAPAEPPSDPDAGPTDKGDAS